MKVPAKQGKNKWKTDPLSHLALTSDFLDNGKEVDPRAPGNSKVSGDTQSIQQERWDYRKHGTVGVISAKRK